MQSEAVNQRKTDNSMENKKKRSNKGPQKTKV